MTILMEGRSIMGNRLNRYRQFGVHTSKHFIVIVQIILFLMSCVTVNHATAQTLVVVPDESIAIRFFGFEGMNFVPVTGITWYVGDTDNIGLAYSAVGDQAWLTVLPNIGVIEGAEVEAVTIGVNQLVAGTMAAGTYVSTVTFRNIMHPENTAARNVILEIAPAHFTVSPTYVDVSAAEGAASPGPVTVTLTNVGLPDLTYSLIWVPSPWFTIGKTGGTVIGNGTDTFDITFNIAGLSPGIYQSQVIVHNNTTSMGGAVVTIVLVVTPPATGHVLSIAPVAEGGAISVQPPGTPVFPGSTNMLIFDPWEIVELEFVPQDGYQFKGWVGDVPIMSVFFNPINIIMDESKTIGALVSSILWQLDLTINGSGTGTVNVTPPGTVADSVLVSEYQNGTQVSLSATPTAGSVFTGWTGNLPEEHRYDNPLTVTMDRERAINAHIEQIVDITIDVVGAGSVSVTPESNSYYLGMNVTLKAQPASGNLFVGWRGSIESDMAELPLTLVEDINAEAVFQAGQSQSSQTGTSGEGTYSLTSDIEGRGVITPASGQFDAGSILRLVATPDVNWRFVDWGGDATGTGLTAEITFDSDRYVVARFEADPNAVSSQSSAQSVPTCGLIGAGFLPTLLLGMIAVRRSSRLTVPRRGRRC